VLQRIGKFNPSVFSNLDPATVTEIEKSGEKVEA